MADKYAIIRAQGKQVTVSPGKTVSVDRLSGQVGDVITFSDVLLLADGDKVTVGSPLISGGKVTAKILSHFRDKKVMTFKKRIKKGYTKRQGHRQDKSRLLIESVA